MLEGSCVKGRRSSQVFSHFANWLCGFPRHGGWWFGDAWRFRDRPLIWVILFDYLTYNPLITTHEAPSSCGDSVGARVSHHDPRSPLAATPLS